MRPRLTTCKASFPPQLQCRLRPCLTHVLMYHGRRHVTATTTYYASASTTIDAGICSLLATCQKDACSSGLNNSPIKGPLPVMLHGSQNHFLRQLSIIQERQAAALTMLAECNAQLSALLGAQREAGPTLASLNLEPALGAPLPFSTEPEQLSRPSSELATPHRPPLKRSRVSPTLASQDITSSQEDDCLLEAAARLERGCLALQPAFPHPTHRSASSSTMMVHLSPISDVLPTTPPRPSNQIPTWDEMVRRNSTHPIFGVWPDSQSDD